MARARFGRVAWSKFEPTVGRVESPVIAGGENRTAGLGYRVSARTARVAGQKLRVIEPKLMLPRVHAGTLRRTRLLEMLDEHGASVLTVLDAGAGYGERTLVRSWCIERPEPVIWMTLDPADDDPVRLWMHLATAVDRLAHGLGARALTHLGVRRVQGRPTSTS